MTAPPAFLDIASVLGFADQPLSQPKSSIDPMLVVRGADLWEKTNVLYADPLGELTVGIWESCDGAWRIETIEDEYVRLLRGRITITDTAGDARRFNPGDSFFVPEKFKGTWENVGEVRKIFVSLKRKRG